MIFCYIGYSKLEYIIKRGNNRYKKLKLHRKKTIQIENYKQKDYTIQKKDYTI